MPKLPKGYHDNTVCSNCGIDHTSGNWRRTYNKDGKWDYKSYHCERCRNYFIHKTGKFSKSFKNPDLNEKLEINYLNYDSVLLINTRNTNGHKDTICSKCGSDYASTWHKKYDENKKWDGTYICKACYANPACRSGKLNPNSNMYKGIVGERTTAKILGYTNCILMRQGSQFDINTRKHIDNKYGRIEVKTSTYHSIDKLWMASNIKPGFFDTLFIICTDKKFEKIKRVYIIPGDKVDVTGISIIKNPSRGDLYDEFRVNDIILYQEVFETVKNDIQISKNYVDNGENLSSNKEKGDICKLIIDETKKAMINIDINYKLIYEGYKRIKVNGSSYYSRHKKWAIGRIKSSKFDTLFIVCMSSNFERVERVYIILNDDISNIDSIGILKNHSANAWYNKFRVDEKPYQEAYERILKGEIAIY